jgi:hypothetical protein
MRRSIAVLAALVVTVLLAIPAVGTTTKPPKDVSVDTLVQTCYHDIGSTINTPQYAVCRGLQALTSSVAAMCRTPARDLPSQAIIDDCRLVDGRTISEAQIANYRKSWVHRALTLQNPLDARAPLFEATFPGTHNSFNASSYFVPANGKPVDYYPTLTNQDPNQVYSITDQLRMDIRAIEVDLHWVPSAYGNAKTGGHWVDVCHGDSEAAAQSGQHVHVGCTVDRSLQNTLTEIRQWLNHHRHQFLLIYLENQLDNNPMAHQVAASLIRQHLGRLVYRPHGHRTSGHCAQMPDAKSRHQMQRAGARVLLVGNCGPGAWNRWVFTRGDKWNEGGNPTTYGAKDCTADEAGHENHSTFRRWYEESPFLEAATEATQTLTAKTTGLMVHCGVNLTGWDQLTPRDGRLRAFVWSWAKTFPRAGHGRCAYQAKNGRFRNTSCRTRLRFACVDRHYDWHVTHAAGPWHAGRAACRANFPGSRFGVPPNGYRNGQIRAAKAHRHGRVWLDYAKVGHRWRPDPPAHLLR